MDFTDRELQIIECALSYVNEDLKDCAANTAFPADRHNQAVTDSALCNRLLKRFKKELSERNVPLDEMLNDNFVDMGDGFIFGANV